MTDSAETMRDLKHSKVFSFDDGLLTIKISGYGQEDGWGTLAFHERQIEIDADGFHCVEIAPSELREIRDFLNRVTKPGPSDPIPSQPDERDRIQQIIELAMIEEAEIQYADFADRDRQREKIITSAAAAILAMLAERRGGESRPIAADDATLDYILRYGPRCRDCADENGICPASGLPCDCDQARKAVLHVLDALNYGQQHNYIAPINAQPALIAGLEPVAWRFTARDAYAVTMERAWATARGKNVSALVTIEQAQAYAAAQVAGAVAKEREACLLAIADVDQALIDAADYFDNRADVNDGDYGVPSPNREMTLASQCDEALERLEALRTHGSQP
jgi:hypothetical protein